MRLARGLYAVTSQALCDEPARLLEAAAAALRGGAVMLQYRDKRSSPAQRLACASALAALCREHGALLIINDDVELAHSAQAAGVHLGSSDAPLPAARARLGPGAIIGVTCSNSLARVHAAAGGGADYAALGRFFPSTTKPDAPQAAPDLAAQARAVHPQLPLCAIGGLTPDNAGPLVAAGIDLVAAVEGVFGVDDIEAQCRRYAGLFSATRG